MFLAYGAANLLVFLVVFEPLLASGRGNVPALEMLVAGLDALSIKLLTRLDGLQGADFNGLTWLRALCISCAGNAVSYFIGNIASQKPWEH